jgi:glutaredoxin
MNNLNFVSSFYLFFSLIGVFISFEIGKTYFRENNVAESKFCSANKEFSCNTTIKSKKYAFSNYVEFVDLPIIFFGFTTIGLLFSIVSLNTIGLLSSLSLPIVVYSIYIQKKVLQKWCALCLLISLTLIANSILYGYFQLEIKVIRLVEILLLMIMVVLWFFVKKLLITKEENKKTIHQLLRFKRNEDVFNAISNNIIDGKEFLSLPKITFGNINAPNTLTLFLSPSCPHCHTAFKEALEVLEKHDEKIKIEIAYNLNINNVENPYLEIAKTIMQLFNQNKDYKFALIDWHIKKLNLEEWKAKWKQNEDFIIENEQLEKQFQWCLKNEFNYAPVKIFNDKLMPQSYEIAELFYFFKEEN